MAGSLNDKLAGALVLVDATTGRYAIEVSGLGSADQGVPIETSLPVAARVTSITDTSTAAVAAPGAGAAISTTASIPGGTYEVTVNSMITGTPADADVPNMRLLIGATPVTRILNPGGAVVSTAKVKLDTGGGVLSVVAVAAATAGTKYWAQIIATRIN